VDATASASLFSSAVAPNGTLYATWITPASDSKRFSVMLVQSDDGGLLWSVPQSVRANIPGPPEDGVQVISAPSIAVNSSGAVAISFYDHRNDPDGTNRVTDYWALVSAGGSWPEEHIAGPFDRHASTTTSTDHVLGDYEGLAAAGDAFVAAFALSASLPGANFALVKPAKNTDIFFAERVAS
jgi:hypothetical protein